MRAHFFDANSWKLVFKSLIKIWLRTTANQISVRCSVIENRLIWIWSEGNVVGKVDSDSTVFYTKILFVKQISDKYYNELFCLLK